MISAPELRIGDFVYVDNSQQICTITEIKEKTVRVLYLRSDTGKNHNSIIEIVRIKPIPLTEEWLLKFGFEKYDDMILYWELDDVTIWEEKGKYQFFSDKNIKYVHQLQNLYFALTEKELELKD
jgi:hypothetical protein